MQDGQFLGGGGVAHTYTHQEAVELRLRQREGAIQLDWILRGKRQEGRGQRIRLAIHRHLALGHRLQKGRLCARRRTVDLIEEQHLAEDGAWTEDEITTLLIEETDACYVGRLQVGRPLDTLKTGVECARQ